MSRGISGFQTARFSQALAARKLSQFQVATLVGVSPSTVSKWRSGQQAPEVAALERLATLVSVAPEWFTRPPSSDISLPLFRSNASAHVASREMLHARVTWSQDIILSLGEFVDFPVVTLPTRNFLSPEEISDLEIERAAAECRELWQLGRGPIADLLLAMESAGVIVVREETGITQIEGLSAWSEAVGRPIVLLSADKANGFRGRFDVGHELGHLILHRDVPASVSREQHILLEQQAHKFAGAMLLPAETFAAEVRTPVTLDDLLLLKQRWGVSVAAMIMRLRALEIIGDDEKQSLFKRRSARWGAKSEPGDTQRPPEQPRVLRRTIELLASSGVLPIEGVARHIGLSARDIESIVGLPLGFLNGTAQVVNLATLRTDSAQDSSKSDEARASTVLQFRGRSIACRTRRGSHCSVTN